MSVERVAVIVRGIQVNETTWNNLTDDFRDAWSINFNGWCEGGPYIIGYEIQRCGEGRIYEVDSSEIYNEYLDNSLIAECAKNDIVITKDSIKTYFGVAVW